MFATSNTIGLGDTTGLYHGTQQINQGQMDRWNLVVTLNYLPAATEAQIVLAKSGEYDHADGKKTVENMIKVADLRSEEHTSELQSLMRISYAVFCLKNNTTKENI